MTAKEQSARASLVVQRIQTKLVGSREPVRVCTVIALCHLKPTAASTACGLPYFTSQPSHLHTHLSPTPTPRAMVLSPHPPNSLLGLQL